MAASDSLSPVQFRREPDKDYDKAAEHDAKGADEDSNFGYSAFDPGDSQYQRYGRDETDTNPGRETF